MSLLVVKEVHLPICLLRVFLLYLSSHWVLEANNEVHLRAHATLVRPKHDGVGGLVSKFFLQGGKCIKSMRG